MHVFLEVENSIDDPMDVPHLFIQNKKVNECTMQQLVKSFRLKQ